MYYVSLSFPQSNNQGMRDVNAPANTIKIPNTEIYVSKNDERAPMRYNVAKSTCACKGKGWRLPTIGELQIIYDNNNMFGNFIRDWYWAIDPAGSEEMRSIFWSGHSTYTDRFYNLNFKNGKVDDEEEYGTNYVRCIWSPIVPE